MPPQADENPGATQFENPIARSRENTELAKWKVKMERQVTHSDRTFGGGSIMDHSMFANSTEEQGSPRAERAKWKAKMQKQVREMK